MFKVGDKVKVNFDILGIESKDDYERIFGYEVTDNDLNLNLQTHTITNIQSETFPYIFILDGKCNMPFSTNEIILG